MGRPAEVRAYAERIELRQAGQLGAIDEDYPEAATWAERALAKNRRFAVALPALPVARVKLDEMEQARRAVEELRAIKPELTVSGLFARIPCPLEQMLRTYAEALTAAGLPE